MFPLNAFYLKMWFTFFLLTQVIEIPIYSLAMRRMFSPWWRVLGWAFVASLLTHPIVWFGFPWLSGDYYVLYVWAELFAVLVEAAYLKWLGFSLWMALFWSCVANASSVAFGEYLHRVLHWI